jgi:hypothetical protein
MPVVEIIIHRPIRLVYQHEMPWGIFLPYKYTPVVHCSEKALYGVSKIFCKPIFRRKEITADL